MKIIKNIKLSKKQQKAINLAKNIALNSPCHHRHGAVLINKGNALINIAFNNYDYCAFGERFNKKNKKKDWTATRHAELGAVLNIPLKLTSGGTIFVVRINRLGEFRNSFPCNMCQDVLRFCKIKKVIFSDKIGFSLIKM